jgi:hypothetical protein
MAQDWTTPAGLREIARTRAVLIEGWRPPVAFAVGHLAAGHWVFPHVNGSDAGAGLTAVILAETVGHTAGTREYRLSAGQLDSAIAQLAPAAAAVELRHPNLAAWRKVAAAATAQIAAVFVGDLADPPAGPADTALRRLL